MWFLTLISSSAKGCVNITEYYISVYKLLLTNKFIFSTLFPALLPANMYLNYSNYILLTLHIRPLISQA